MSVRVRARVRLLSRGLRESSYEKLARQRGGRVEVPIARLGHLLRVRMRVKVRVRVGVRVRFRAGPGAVQGWGQG